MVLSDYNKIKDTYAYIGNISIGVEVEVKLYRKNKNGSTGYNPFYNEFSYSNNKTNEKMLGMNREIRSSLILAGTGDFRGGKIAISYNVLWSFMMNCEYIVSNIGNLFIDDNGIQKPNQEMFQSMVSQYGTVIHIEPWIDNNETNDNKLRVKVSEEGGFGFSLSLNDFYGFVQIISSMNIPILANQMLQFLPDPEYGKNVYDLDNQTNSDYETRIMSRKKGFFDK